MILINSRITIIMKSNSSYSYDCIDSNGDNGNNDQKTTRIIMILITKDYNKRTN